MKMVLFPDCCTWHLPYREHSKPSPYNKRYSRLFDGKKKPTVIRWTTRGRCANNDNLNDMDFACRAQKRATANRLCPFESMAVLYRLHGQYVRLRSGVLNPVGYCGVTIFKSRLPGASGTPSVTFPSTRESSGSVIRLANTYSL